MQKLRLVGKEVGDLTANEYQFVERQVVETVKPRLIGRRIFAKTPLSDAGYMNIKYYKETDMSAASISLYGEEENVDAVKNASVNLDIPIIHKDFMLHWREVLAGRHSGESLDAANARNAARQVAEDEDILLLSGEHTNWPAMGIEGLATATGRSTQASAGAWPANAITDINASKAQLKASGFVDVPIVMIAPTAEVEKLDAQIGTSIYTYKNFILQNGLVSAIFESDSLFAADGGVDSAILCVPGKDNFDVVVAQEVTTFLWQNSNMNLKGKVYEALVPRIKRAESICELTGIT